MSALREPCVGRFRQMLPIDLKEILSIERRAYEFAWTEGIFRDCLRVGYQCRVLETPHSFIQAYGVMSVAVGEAHILNLCVRPELQGRGLSRQLLDHLLELAISLQAQTVFLEVRLSNQRALRLYASVGFCEVGLRRGYYPASKGREDGWVLAKEL
ncbi:MAG: ribosomal protein S18-alanine N-acetyltransferase [Candidatus Competibacteraceae bacterium]|nr:ribosomal protein S18-alanine N-acetyltransferase [Candidatus Competibacteraceae bacterium]MBK7984102.1 ribosomal protein S18-alanine N-acetyltransferase [Candidatus Competibacteraceae bacterium]MBK8896078.1 ribosomal protein S18-alanine N-acetyltransferase [Candidatus Competibacteraceae bacterium]MBK8963507.1 ribosomal protein S18-alanine N-acetyltransferase [Candidatus Competibacteraceae bacterium]MBK9950400.1 ribosomal protein S18-alanine N-acetyltransferase [Candidatus Competibacteraceae